MSRGEEQPFSARAYLVIGGAMGWAPDVVRACSLSDFTAAFEGWRKANGVPDAPAEPSPDDVRDMRRSLFREDA